MALNAILGFTNSKLIPMLLAIIGFGLLIVVHEFGHFLFAKAFGIYTPTFSVGFGPALYEKKIGTTNFRIAKIPFGGYVEIAGLAEVGQGEQKFAQAPGEISFAEKPYWQKFLVLMGGILFNLLFAYGVFCTLFMIGDPHREPIVTVANIVKASAADTYGLKPGDKILAINKVKHDPNRNLESLQKDFLKEIQNNPNKKIELSVKRLVDKKEKIVDLSITLGEKKFDNKLIGSLGAYFSAPIQKLPFIQAIQTGINHTNQWIVNILYSFKMMFSQRTLKGAGGPVMIVAQTFKFAQSGLIPLFVFLAIMSLNLAIFNLLPIGILDGGNLLFVTIEAIIRRPVPEVIRTGVNVLSLILFLSLALYLTYQDVMNLFGGFIAKFYSKIIGLFK